MFAFLTKRSAHLFMLIMCSFIIASVVSACGGESASSSPTPTSQPTAAATATSAPIGQTYTGDGYTISYPSDLKPNTATPGQVIFANASNTVAFLIKVVDHPGAGQTATSIVGAVVQGFQSRPNFQLATDVLSSTMVGGDTWNQAGATYDAPNASGQATNVKIVVLADGHPANSPMLKGFLIVYSATTDIFDQTNTNTFQPMLQSFKFTS